MPDGGHFFDAIIRQDPINEDKLDPENNLEEFSAISDEELTHYQQETDRLYNGTSRALFCTFGGLTFGDIALVPATWLKNPKGIRDIEEWYVSTIMRKDYIKAVFQKQAEIAVENLKRLYEAVGNRITVIQTNGTDFGTQNGPFLSPEQYREMYQPYQRIVHDWIHENTSWKTFMHCCGGVEPLIDDIVEAGFDILNPVQCSAAGMDSKLLKEKYGDRITFWGGGVDTQKTLPFGTPEQVKEEVKQRIDVFSKGGGFVFCSIHNVVANVPIKNLLAMFEAVKET
jgi:uroporphyrinogen-III decarboxylase